MNHPSFPNPPAWGMFLGVFGKALVFAALACFVISCLAWLLSGNKEKLRKIGAMFFVAGALFVGATFAAHAALLLGQQYQFAYVFQNTQRDMPFIYRLSAAWAAQEGSFLLWTLTSSVIAAIAARSVGIYRRWYSVISALAVSAMLAIVAHESPFKLLPLSETDRALLSPGQTMLMPPDGRGLNPTLENYWMAIHPWVIFIGFGSLLALFAWAGAAVIEKDLRSWVAPLRPYAIFSTTVLGIGLTMGGLWAYETLGWGGFWAWDPVENVSLVPFLAATVLTHGLYVQANRERWSRLNVLLAMLPFMWFVYGTYLTRSGALVKVSVHSFAEMSSGAHGWLLGLVIATAVALIGLTIAAFRISRPRGPRPNGERQTGIGIGMAFLYAIAIFAVFGMSVPFLASLGLNVLRFTGGTSGEPIVAEGIYNQIIAYPFVPALLAMAIVPFIGWTKTRSERWNLLATLFFVTVLVFGIVVFFMTRSGFMLEPSGKMPTLQITVFLGLVFVCLFSIIANGMRLFERIRARTGGLGSFVMHAGVSMLLLGLIVSRAFEKTDISQVALTEPARLSLLPSQSYIAMLDSMPTEEKLVDSSNALQFTLRNERTGASLDFRPGFYYAIRDGNLITRPDIKRTPLYDLYFVVGSPQLEIQSGITLKPGERKEAGDFTLTYVRPSRTGEPGQMGTRFGAHVIVSYKGAEFETHPELELSGPPNGIVRRSSRVGDLAVLTLERLDASNNEATFSLLPPEPIFPIQMFYKPLTSLVWLGAGMMTLGGIFAIGRRRKRAPDASHTDETTQSPEIEDTSRAGELCEPGIRGQR